MQAIRTKYICPTNFKGARIQAKAEAGTRYFSYDHSLSVEFNHIKAAKLFAEEFKWNYGEYIGGQFANDYYWTMADRKGMSPRFVPA